jgi:hypothetical protein
VVHFRHRLPTAEDIALLKQFCIIQGNTPWNPSAFSDQMADKFYQQVIDTENYNTCLDSTTKSCPLQYNGQKVSFYDPSDLLMNNTKGKPAHLTFHADSVQKNNIYISILVDTDSHFSKALPSKID